MAGNHPIYPDMISKQLTLADAILENRDISIDDVSRYFSTLNGKGAIARIINEQNQSGETALHVAVRIGNPDLVKHLLDNGADVNAVNKRRTTALNIAVPGKYSEVTNPKSSYEIQKILIKNGASIDKDVQKKIKKNASHNRFGREASPIRHNETEGRNVFVKALNAVNPYQTVKLIEKNWREKIRPNRVKKFSKDQFILQDKLYNAAINGDIGQVKYCLKHGVDVNAGNSNTALMAACWAGHSRVVDLLVGNKAILDIANHYGETALMAACWAGHSNIAKHLMSEGADTQRKTVKGETACTYTIDLAKSCLPSTPFEKSTLKLSNPKLATEKPINNGRQTWLPRPGPVRGLLSAAFTGNQPVATKGR